MIFGRRGPRRRRPSTRDLVPLEAITAGALHFKGGALRVVMECPTLAFGIKGPDEQRALIDGWAALLTSLSHSLEIVIRSRQVDPHAVAPLADASAEAHTSMRDSYQRLLRELADQRRVLDRRFFVVVPYDPVGMHRRISEGEGLEVLEQRSYWIEAALRRLDLEPRRLSDRELADLLRRTLDPPSAAQPLAPEDPLERALDLVAPSAFEERPGHVALGGRLARTIAVSRYPSRLHPGWLGDLHAFDADLDLALHLHPSAGPAVMSFLERRVAELSSTLRIAEQHGALGDPYRRAALQDALELQDRIAQGSERLFDVDLFVTIWAANVDELESATRKMEALFGARLIHTRRLHFQMRSGLVSSLPLGIEQVSVRRVLSTTALSATFPFTGTDLPARSGLLYGVNTQSKSPVVLDRFAFENHNAVVFATSGAGKSYLVKVELARALLSGMRALVIDPEGEYTPLVKALGGTIVPVRPGAADGLDPFVHRDGAPGALSAKIAALTTLLSLLAGGLKPQERAAVGDAIARSFAHAGFADGRATDGLVSPRFHDVYERVRGIRAMEALALRLEPYAAGAGSWLFHRDGANGAEHDLDGATTAYALAGLPDEERAAAMFLVLEQIWSNLRSSDRPTLVVVDEAWWLMRYADTAAFLFRLVKTSRKRRAGLTLVTQDVGDVLTSTDGEAVIANSALQILLRQAPQAMPRLAQLFRLTSAEQTWLLGAQRGEGLLVAQGRRVPFQVIATDEEARLIERREAAA